MSAVRPVRREIVVDAEPDVAFEVFTGQIGSWWPLAEHSLHGASSTLSFVGNEIVEMSADGQRALWGTVTDWQPGQHIAFTWHPGRTADAAGSVSITFTATQGQTLVTLVHDGWESFADPAAVRAEYDEGWPIVLSRYAEHTVGRRRTNTAAAT
jgi:uncharacterized protein YndB with AHSA1/START domain